jgi:protein TonB
MLFNITVCAKDLPRWKFHREKTEFVLTNFCDSMKIFPIKKIDSITYSIEGMQFYCTSEIKATFPGDSLSIFIKNNLDIVEYSNIYPKVYIGFIVNEFGKICNIGVYRGADEKFNKASINLVRKMPDWQPAIRQNKYVNSFNILVIDFAIK